MEIHANESISTSARKVNQEIHRNTVCHKDAAVLTLQRGVAGTARIQ